MKYDILEPFKEYLREQLPKNTARTYYSAVVKLFKDVQFSNLNEIDSEWIGQTAAKAFKTKSEFSAVKNGLLWLKRYDHSLRLPTEDEFKSISIRKRNFSKKPKKVIFLGPTQRRINQISNERFKYAYRLMEISGLRVSEAADLEAPDIWFVNEKIYVRVRNGKGGHGGIIECREDAYLRERLPDYLKKYPEGKLFYSESYMREYAAKLGLECHDLRRIYSIQCRNELRKEMPIEEANIKVQQRLRHARFSTTKRYLFNRKLKFEYEKEKKEPVTEDE